MNPRNRIFRVPEVEKRKELMDEIRPLVVELISQSRNEKQREIDNSIIESASDLIRAARENGLRITTDDLSLDPLWNDAVVMSDRKVKSVMEYVEERKEAHIAKIEANFEINKDNTTIKAKIYCRTEFDDLMNPNAATVLLVNDNISDKYDTDVKVFDKSNCTYTIMKVQGDEEEIEHKGGEVTVSFTMKKPLGEPISNMVRNLRSITKKYAEKPLFEKGTVKLKVLDEQSRVIREDDLTESQFNDFILSGDGFD